MIIRASDRQHASIIEFENFSSVEASSRWKRRLTNPQRSDNVDPDVDQASANYYGQETKDAHYHVVH